MTDWTIILRSLRARLFSTITTVLTVAVAVALLLVLLTLRDSGRQAFERGSGNMHLLVSRDASPLAGVLNGIFYANPRAPIQWAEFEKLAASRPFEWAIPVQLGDSFRARFPVLATTPDFLTRFEPAPGSPWTFRDGRVFAADFEVVAGAVAAREAGLKLDQRIVLTHGVPKTGASAHEHNQFKYTVVGILQPTGTAHDRALFTNLQSAWIIHAHDRIERATGHDGHDHADHDEEHADHDHDHADHDHADHEGHDHAEEPPTTAADLIEADRLITNVYLRVATRPGSDVSSAIAPTFDALRRDTSITVAAPSREIEKLFEIVSNIDQILLAIAGAVMVSSGIAIMLALYNSMEQRRRQVAVLRVLGAASGRIFGLIITESAILGVLGAAVGVALGVGGAYLAAQVLRARVGVVIDPNLQPGAIMIVAAASLLLAILAGIAPAVAAYRTSVARNLRPQA